MSSPIPMDMVPYHHFYIKNPIHIVLLMLSLLAPSSFCSLHYTCHIWLFTIYKTYPDKPVNYINLVFMSKLWGKMETRQNMLTYVNWYLFMQLCDTSFTGSSIEKYIPITFFACCFQSYFWEMIHAAELSCSHTICSPS